MNHVIVADLGYGDSGKGTVVDWLCSPLSGGEPVRTVVRFNGGAQAAHNVVTPDGRHHTFSQFGSGTFHPGVWTHLSRFVLVDPLALASEAGRLALAGVPDALDRLTVDREALLVTPWHRAANQAREIARAADRHGSCGAGIGETARYALANPAETPQVRDCAEPRALARKLRLLRDRLTDELGPLDALVSGLLGSPGQPGEPGQHRWPGAPGEPRRRGEPGEPRRRGEHGRVGQRLAGGPGPELADLLDAYAAFAARVELTSEDRLPALLRSGRAVFEGAQGVLLDEWRGFHPYTTWSTTTFANAEALLAEAGQTATRLGVVRTYMTRHGPGPFVTEDPTLELPEPHNTRGVWQGPFRTGHFDAVALRYAAEITGSVDAVALTHLDVAAAKPLRLCRAYEEADGQPIKRLVPGPERDLDWQERLTHRLLRARPVYADAVPGQGNWPDVVAQVLGAPVAVASYGPTAADKRAVTRVLRDSLLELPH